MGIADLALGAAPIAGGALLGVAAGNLKPADTRGMITKDMDLLERIPDDRPELKARLKASIDERIDDLITNTERGRELKLAAMSYAGNWRDIVVFICAVLFTIIWWNVSHSRSNWLLLFIVMIVLSIVAGIYAGRGLARAIRRFMRRDEPEPQMPPEAPSP
jgi:ABC-type antimicrobial peptide transport system permease subunit